MEKWKPIVGYEGLYEISNLGRVKSMARVIKRSINGEQKVGEIFLKFELASNGYYRVSLWKDNVKKNKTIHRLVATHFVNNTNNKKTVNHKDGNKLNNKASNLEWATYCENNGHAFKNKLINTSKQVIQIDPITLNAVNEFESLSDAARKTEANQSHISRCCNNKRKLAGGFKWKFKYCKN